MQFPLRVFKGGLIQAISLNSQVSASRNISVHFRHFIWSTSTRLTSLTTLVLMVGSA